METYHYFPTLHGRKCVITYDESSDQTKGYDVEDIDNKRMFIMQDGHLKYHDDWAKRLIDYAHITFIMTNLTQMEYHLGLVQHGCQDN